MSTRALAERATAVALRLRMLHGRGLSVPICPYDLALDMGVEVRFDGIPSLEGIYQAGPSPVVVLNSLRPPGRRAYNCAHELGHHMLGHGTQVDELLESADAGFDSNEYAADRFASALLMPKVAVARAFTERECTVATATAVEVFAIAGYLGVGYRTLVGYLEGTLGMLLPARATELRRYSPKAIRRELVGADDEAGVFLVNEKWTGRPVDVEVGDLLLVENHRGMAGNCIVATSVGGQVAAVRAVRAGSGTLDVGHSLVVRVCRREYRGLAEYRHLEDPDEDDA